MGKNYLGAVNAAQLVKLAEAHETPGGGGGQSFDAYCHGGGYETLKSLRAGAKTPDQVIEELLEAGLRAWAAPASRRARNGSSCAPARATLSVHQCRRGRARDVQGSPLSADPAASVSRRHADRRLGVEAEKAFIYLRDEYPAAHQILRTEIALIEREGLIALAMSTSGAAPAPIFAARRSAMIESVEGKRGLPRHRPPYVAQIGIFGRPTLVHNVETVYWMPQILAKGAAAFAALGKEDTRASAPIRYRAGSRPRGRAGAGRNHRQ